MAEKLAPQRKPTQFKFVGLSGDGRANVWSVECGACGKWFKPPTTLITWQSFDCPRCGARHSANWNDDIVEYTP